MFNSFVKNNIPLVSIILLSAIFMFIILTKPSLMFDKNGKPRQFGLGYKNKTVCPLWLAVIVSGIVCYLAVLTFTNYKRLMY
ncbi:hypothetical protein PGAG_00133 [Phaeocystis globosa virus 12T]|uniref:Uncharacterized protein n=1 Tax=Phaeocystis globosa virus PgV-16T TaxID=3071227 RepID=A0AC59EX02_9VIRU|nr:hypothetical protein PGCG_00174 [Phaeocystis globosa virus]AET73022.1 hypothetical protein PGAG_00133 [Phaeocystis globosa virus 12T]AET73845.1 hypothetical protein PGBG_00137 [Phaeocystis globosa virus 14T]AGM15485.1 hypothetical protein PGCG_00174 [Phaeocystis globosa virus PgV-16T]UYE94215.1 hypothetical protein PGV14T_00174 [Phaeocystis globosa virus]